MSLLDVLLGRKPVQPLLARPNFHVTLWPAFPHFPRFSQDDRLDGIRLNSAMMDAAEIDDDFNTKVEAATIPLWFDIKGMQLRIREVLTDHKTDKHLEIILNRPIILDRKVSHFQPCIIEFKAGEDAAKCIAMEDGGKRLVFESWPKFEVRAGESIHVREPHTTDGPVFLPYEIEKIEKIVALGFNNFYLSYVWDQRHVDEFREYIGKDAQLRLKIENPRGLNWVSSGWRPQANTNLVAARGDLYVEIDYPHQIMQACKLIIGADPGATVGSRMLLSLVTQNYPRCADLSDLSWLYDIGYRNFLLCDELCLKENLMATCVNIFDAFRNDYCLS